MLAQPRSAFSVPKQFLPPKSYMLRGAGRNCDAQERAAVRLRVAN